MNLFRNYRFAVASVTLVLLVLLSSGLTGCTSVKTPDLSATRMVDISSGDEEIAKLETFFQGQRLVEPLIIKIPAGFALPVRITLDTPIARMAGDCGDLVFTRDIYLYMSEQMMLVSPDRSRWAPFADLEGIKDLFAAGRGEINLGMSADKSSGPLLEIGATIHPKQQ
jgi:hypothetical protein